MDITGIKRSEEEREHLYAEKEKILKDLHDGIGRAFHEHQPARGGSPRRAIASRISELACDHRGPLAREPSGDPRVHPQPRYAELSWQAVAAELRSLGSAIIEPHGIKLSIETAVLDQGPRPGSTVVMNLFRIYKESLANIVKHAKATSVTIIFKVHDGAGGARYSVTTAWDWVRNAGPAGGSSICRPAPTRSAACLPLNSTGGTRVLLQVPVS